MAIKEQTLDVEAERQGFENWATDGGFYPQAIERRGDQYKLMQTHCYWQVWLARASMDPILADLRKGR